MARHDEALLSATAPSGTDYYATLQRTTDNGVRVDLTALESIASPDLGAVDALIAQALGRSFEDRAVDHVELTSRGSPRKLFEGLGVITDKGDAVSCHVTREDYQSLRRS